MGPQNAVSRISTFGGATRTDMEIPPQLRAEAHIGIPGECRLLRAKRKRQTENIKVAFSHQYNAPVNFMAFAPFDANGQLDGGFVDDSSGSVALRRPDRLLIVCAGTRVSLISLETRKVVQELTDFQNFALCCRFRPDGKLLITSDGDGTVRILQAQGRSTLRTYRAHTQAVRRVAFLSNTMAVSAGDDLRAVVYDISSSEPMFSLDEVHADAISSLEVPRPKRVKKKEEAGETDEFSEDCKNVFLTASQDNFVKVWDIRRRRRRHRTDLEPVACLKHPGAVAAAVFIPGSTTQIVSASESTIYLWDISKPVAESPKDGEATIHTPLSSHRLHLGTIRDLHVSADGLRVLTAASDFTLKICDCLDPATMDDQSGESVFNILRALETPGTPTAAAMDHNELLYACGTENGTLTLWQRLDVETPEPENEFGFLPGTKQRRAGTKIYFMRGRDSKPDDNAIVVSPPTRRVMKQLPATTERLLQSFQYQKAVIGTILLKSPETFAGLCEELLTRGAMDIAMRGHDLRDTRLILDYFCKLCRKPMPAYQSVFLLALNSFLDQNSSYLVECCEESLVESLDKMKTAVQSEITRKGPLAELASAAELVLARSKQQMS